MWPTFAANRPCPLGEITPTPMTREQAWEYLCWEYPHPYEFYTTPAQYRAQELQDILSHPGEDDYFALTGQDGLLVGFLEYSFPDGRMEIGLGLRPDCTGLGWGSRLMELCLSFGQARYRWAGKPVFLLVAGWNQRAIRTYQRAGFVVTGEEQRLSFGAPVRFLVMERTL